MKVGGFALNLLYTAILFDIHFAMKHLFSTVACILCTGKKKRKRKTSQYTAPAETAAEAAQQMLASKKISSKINYAALVDLFKEPGDDAAAATDKQTPGGGVNSDAATRTSSAGGGAGRLSQQLGTGGLHSSGLSGTTGGSKHGWRQGSFMAAAGGSLSEPTRGLLGSLHQQSSLSRSVTSNSDSNTLMMTNRDGGGREWRLPTQPDSVPPSTSKDTSQRSAGDPVGLLTLNESILGKKAGKGSMGWLS